MPRLLSIAALIAGTLAAATFALAQDAPDFMRRLYPPELIMRHGRDLGLTDAQRTAITTAVKETQAETLDLQWEMQDASQALAQLVGQERVDEKAAVAAAARALEVESRVKRAHLRLLIRIKNQLTPEQQKQLDGLRGVGGGIAR